MLSFSKIEQEKFKKLQNIKDNPWDIEKKLIEKTIRYIRYVKWIPGLKMIAIWNSISMNSANSESDIDLFIVTSPNRLWTVRIFITFVFQILWIRKTSKFHEGRFCLSFFCTTNVLNFENIAIENDIYLYNWINYLIPILNHDNTYELFIEENSKWVEINYELTIMNYKSKETKITSPGAAPSIVRFPSSRWQKQEWQSVILNLLEKILKSIFLPKTKKAFIKLWKPFWVIINDDMLKFHDKDKRIEIRDSIIVN